MIGKKVKDIVKKGYAKIATNESSCGCGGSCCSGTTVENISSGSGYNKKDMSSVPEGSNLGLGCGNPVAMASLKKGETVLDLGAGAGFDCFLASKRVGKSGKVIGLDMTKEMVEKARSNALRGGYKNVEFLLGEIENIPLADNSVNTVISNCVINLSPEKGKVFKEIRRVLKPGGRFMVSDIVLSKPLPKNIKNSANAYVGCVSGAILKKKYLDFIKKAGFQNIEITQEKEFPVDYILGDTASTTAGSGTKSTKIYSGKKPNIIISISVRAYKN